MLHKKEDSKSLSFFCAASCSHPRASRCPQGQHPLNQPEICKAGWDGSEAAVRHIRALSQPKSSGIASRCATGVSRLGMITLCEFRVSASSCHFDRAKRAEKSSSTWERTKRPPNVPSAVLVICTPKFGHYYYEVNEKE